MRLVAAFAVGVIVACGLSSPFACEDDTQCEGGICQAVGWCSFPDGDCPSGQRFGEHSGDGLAQMCVDVDGTTGGHDDAGSTSGRHDTTTSGIDVDEYGDTTLALDDTGASDGSGSLDDATTNVDDADTTGPFIDPPDPIAWYSFDDPQDMFADVSGNAHHAFCVPELAECPMPVAGIIGIAVEFAGAVEHGHIEHGPWLETATELSLAVWVLHGPMNGDYQSLVVKPLGGPPASSWSIGLTDMGTTVEAHIESATEVGFAVGDFPVDAEWHHVASVWDGNEVRIYVDGVLAGSAPASGIEFDSSPVSIGAGVGGMGDANFFAGTLDELRIYDVALSDDVVAVLATPP